MWPNVVLSGRHLLIFSTYGALPGADKHSECCTDLLWLGGCDAQYWMHDEDIACVMKTTPADGVRLVPARPVILILRKAESDGPQFHPRPPRIIAAAIAAAAAAGASAGAIGLLALLLGARIGLVFLLEMYRKPSR